ncbi:MAG: tRNA 2-thiouridine(34) synthase MnmA [Candidatus Omnitrophica bacterium]|nr:tRNA 2-thiouridine(34) synthase MnmA [Candidatus Omnitrophota bacterium]
MEKIKVIVGLSGGIDSSISAVLLKEKGYDVVGVFMEIFDERDKKFLDFKNACYGPEEKDIEDIEKICKILNIPFHIIDLKKEYKKIVLQYFKDEYLKGRTPNPCVVCNRFLKFDMLLKKVFSLGINFNYFATGHYARVEYDKRRGRYILKKGIDTEKDQSYFLFLLTQEQLSKIIFPLGNYTKEMVRKIAKDYGLPLLDKKESQDFISGDRFFLFEKNRKEGFIVDKNGNILGKHKGIIYYTIGQRRGLGISTGKPLYVVEINGEENKIVVGEENDLYKKGLIVENVNFVSIERLKKEMKVEVKIRYKHSPAKAIIRPIDESRVEVIFEKNQKAPTPGQAAVFYIKDKLIGGGFISSVF